MNAVELKVDGFFARPGIEQGPHDLHEDIERFFQLLGVIGHAKCTLCHVEEFLQLIELFRHAILHAASKREVVRQVRIKSRHDVESVATSGRNGQKLSRVHRRQSASGLAHGRVGAVHQLPLALVAIEDKCVVDRILVHPSIQHQGRVADRFHHGKRASIRDARSLKRNQLRNHHVSFGLEHHEVVKNHLLVFFLVLVNTTKDVDNITDGANCSTLARKKHVSLNWDLVPP
mmetsp:Transcript_4465/g.18447  ORF Transcript_4465/g.18447 Transcript_4465/m.18447 type:complete len:231 (+) Transcript_4465:10545-11237(+)